MNIEDVLLEMRDWKWGLSPRVRAWADAIEAAMRERDAEIERLREAVQERDGVIERVLLRELRLRATLNQAAEALDLAQALLERSSHHPKILEAYRQARAALAGEKP